MSVSVCVHAVVSVCVCECVCVGEEKVGWEWCRSTIYLVLVYSD